MTKKPMNMGLQKYMMEKILIKRGNPLREELGGIEACLDSLDPRLHLDENIASFEQEGLLLPVSPGELEEYRLKQILRQQESIDKQEEVRIRELLWKKYGLKRVKVKPVKKTNYQTQK
jgi:hypothetical protein